MHRTVTFATLKVLAALLASVTLMALSAGAVHAQTSTSDRAWFGIYGDFDFNRHSADFKQLPGIPNCCPSFESGEGRSFSAGISYEFTLSPEISLDVRAGWYGYDASLRRDEPTVVVDSGVPVNGVIEHVIEATLGSIGIEPLVNVHVWEGVTVVVGPRIGWVITRTYRQHEKLNAPGEGVFLDTGTRYRNQSEGTLPEASDLHAALIGGLRYRIPLKGDGSLTVVPEVLVSYGLTPVVSGLTWNANSLRFGIALQWTSAFWGD